MFTIKSLAMTDWQAAATANPATTATDRRPRDEAIEAATSATTATTVARVAAVAVAVGGTPELSSVQEAARRDVLARLEAHPTVKRAFRTRFEGAVLVVTLALRGVGTCELSIPADRFNRENLADFDSLLRCLERQE